MNRFKNPELRQAYEACISNARAGLFRNADGSQCNGSSHATHFWAGYNGQLKAFANPRDREYRTTLGYAAYRAGVDYHKEQS